MKHKKCVVYFLRAGELIKIGTTSDYKRRVNALKVMNASPIIELGVIAGGNELERSIHRHFHHCRSHGEWFFAIPELLAYIAKKAVPYEDGLGEIRSSEEKGVYNGFTPSQMSLAGILLARKPESVYQRQVKLTVLGALRLLIKRFKSGGFLEEDYPIQEFITADGKIPALDFEHIEEIFLAMSAGMFHLKYVPRGLLDGEESLMGTYNLELNIMHQDKIDLCRNSWTIRHLQSNVICNELTNEWRKRGVKEEEEIAILMDDIVRETFDIPSAEHKKIKQLKQENLRDHMTGLELAFTILGEAATTEITRQEDAQGFRENQTAARKGGRIAGNARRELEAETGKPIVSETNYLDKPQIEQDRLPSGEESDDDVAF